MNARIIFGLLLLSLSSPALSQQVNLIRREQFAGNFEDVHRELNYDDIEGSPYLDAELIKGYVKFSLGDSAVHFLRYNIHTDQMEYLEGEKLFVIKNPSEVRHVVVNDHYFIYSTFKIRNSFRQGYLEQLVEGRYDLFIKYKVDYEERQDPESSYDKATPDRFVVKPPSWYFRIDSGPIIYFEYDKSGLTELFRDDYPEIKKYIKAEKLKLRKQEDMIRLFEYYNAKK